MSAWGEAPEGVQQDWVGPRNQVYLCSRDIMGLESVKIRETLESWYALKKSR